MMIEPMRPDDEARRRIVVDLDLNFLVEAGAGSGKTQSMVDRMIELVATGRTTVDRIAAVTFTKKAATELRQRFQERLEGRLAESEGDEPTRAWRIGEALTDIDQAFIGTIHSFCARVLREHPLEAGLDPDFEEVSGAAERRLLRDSWDAFRERLEAGEEPALMERLSDTGLRPEQLYDTYGTVVGYPDLEIPTEDAPRPDTELVRRKLERLMDRASGLMPPREPDDGWDSLQTNVRSLRFSRHVLPWDRDEVFFEALERTVAGSNKIIQKRWNESQTGRNPDAKELAADFDDFAGGLGGRTLRAWWAYRYPAAIAFVRAAAAFHEGRRIRLGRLTFQDLLMGAARLLRKSPSARRALAERYRYLLVDEFQDTDPVQAEVVFLLAGEDAGETDWTRVRMRPGALFVVGDPKQSIYRFRRADITVYNRVRSLFEMDPRGEVLELVANFRSTPPFERFVEDVFRDTACGFPSDEATPHQAKFAPLKTQQPDTPESGIYTYTVPGLNQGTVESEDARRLAAWIAARVQDPQDPRTAGDFLVLTWRKRPLAGIAEALERWGIPVQLTGGGVAIEHELAELVALLRSLADPDDPVRAVAVLVGLFFGLDYDALYRHRRGGGRFEFVRPPEGDGPVDRALATMHRWYRRSLEVPGDILVAEIVDQAGLLPLAASGTNGGTRAGSLLFALEVLRQAARSGAASARDMAEALEEAVADAEVEAPLDPGRADAVRVMNLHKAKGLQARVVVLAWPAGHWDHEVTAHVRRDPDGGGEAFFSVREGQGRDARTVAQPADWDSHADAEKAFEMAEQNRLRYVAVTRAREELLVSRCSAMEGGGKSPWGALCEALESHATHLELEDAEPPAREVPDASDTQIVARIRETEASRDRLRAPSHHAAAVTGLVKGERAPGDTGRPAPADGDRSAPGGIPWGNAVHRALEAAVAGMEGESLRTLCRNILAEEGLTDEAGEVLHLDELLMLIGEVRRSDLWKRVEAAQQVLVEIPISFRTSHADVARMVDAEGDGDDAPLVLDGVIDLAFKEDDGWVLVDWKTDRSPTEETVHRYERQLQVYQACWEALSGESVQDRKLFFVRHGTMR